MIPTIRSEVMTFKVGSCAVILTRKYFLGFLFLLVLIASFYVVRTSAMLSCTKSLANQHCQIRRIDLVRCNFTNVSTFFFVTFSMGQGAFSQASPCRNDEDSYFLLFCCL